jgi:hypothetical protein
MTAPGKQKLTPQSNEGIQEIEWVNNKTLNEKLENTYVNIIKIIKEMMFTKK